MTSNPRNIEWPQDTAGFLHGLKQAGVKAVERQMGNPEKHEALMGTLKALYAHAKARFELQADIRQAQKDAAAAESDPQGALDLAEGKTTDKGPEPVTASADAAVDPVVTKVVPAPEKPADDAPAQ